jgi:hypothetical protein
MRGEEGDALLMEKQGLIVEKEEMDSKKEGLERK